MVHILLKSGLVDFEHYFASMWDECNCVVVRTFFGIAFLGTWMKTDLFQSCGHCWVFQIFWHVEFRTFTASSFRVWTISTGIPSTPLALFVVMLPEAHLTSHSRMMVLGEWSHHHGYLGHEDLFCIALMYSCHLFLISSAFLRSIPFLSFVVPIFAWNVPLVSLTFLKRSLVFSILLFSCISLHWSLRNAFLCLLASLWKSAFKWYIFPFLLCLWLLFFSQLFVRPPQTTILPFCISFSWEEALDHWLLNNIMNVYP